MANARVNSNELARQVGIPATTIKRIRNNEHANPTLTTLIPIANYFSISISQLIGNEALSASNKGSVNKLQMIPLLSWQQCFENLIDYKSRSNQVITERKVSETAFALQIKNDDLEFFPKNSILIVEPQRKPETSDYILVANIQQKTISIRKYIIEIDQIYLKPIIKGAEIAVLNSDYKILGVIIQFKVELKSE